VTLLRASVIISTRDRPDQLAPALESVLASLPSGCEVVVVDQSADSRSRRIIETAADSYTGLTYIGSQRRGLSAARNDGAAAARGAVLLFTDDDCIVGADWAAAWLSVLEQEPAAAMGFGRVVPPPFDRTQGHVPHFDPGVATTLHRVLDFRHGASWLGMGANMAVRRGVWEAVGGFDEQLGAGSRFGGAEEIDLAYRAARAGSLVMRTSKPVVTHFGFRVDAAASRLVQGYAAGTGAMLAKHVRCGDAFAAALLANESARLAVTAAVRLVTGRRPLGIRSLRACLIGAVRSVRVPVDRGNHLYRPA
jgi:Glycosyl transferase family 2